MFNRRPCAHWAIIGYNKDIEAGPVCSICHVQNTVLIKIVGIVHHLGTSLQYRAGLAAPRSSNAPGTTPFFISRSFKNKKFLRIILRLVFQRDKQFQPTSFFSTQFVVLFLYDVLRKREILACSYADFLINDQIYEYLSLIHI